ncbi:Site-specific recombinase XerD [Burkholderia pseudomallei]|nr:Site-specific recombinase XerD [Burkholderia pseudomallei]CAJ2787284.1 Site-specific recombinase XerD [Burkholderia pseudomallei]CAJ3661644.1 Site-specific recombinase XerD [Burkholderia pseudomallei]CAJ3950791.1 Site-specific recombinase XerD [Burkholderia pseudomallei]CAJ4248217.1 Site-specific recombinase XerD [Burkholderia pseudomallei]
MNDNSNFLDVYGNQVVVEPHRWTIVTSTGIHRLSWASIDSAGEPLASTIRGYTGNRLQTDSPIEALNCHKYLTGFARFCKSRPTAPMHASALAYLSHLTALGRRSEWARIRSFYRFFAERHHPEFDRRALTTINRLVVGGNRKGGPVKDGHPLDGPFTREESLLWRNAILSDDDDTYEAVQERGVAMLTTILGLRPTSIIHLMESDLVRNVVIDDMPVAFALDIARAKKRAAPRKLLRRIGIHPQLAAILQTLIEFNHERHLEPTSAADRPLFYAPKGNQDFGAAGWRESSTGIGAILQRAVRRYGVISPRTQRPLKIFPTRLRRSAATALAREGYSAEQIASFLDHEDLQNVGIYTDSTRGTVEELDAALADSYAPFFNAFQGAIPKPSSERLNLKSVSYVTDDGQLHTLGECAQENAPCALHPPYSCYGGCEMYRPFSDAEHDALQRDLLTRREKLRKAGTIAKRRMAGLLDLAIVGLAHVKRLIKELTDA